MIILGGVLYLLFATIVALLLKSRRVGFWGMFLLSLLLTPLFVAILGLIFYNDPYKENTRTG